MFKYILKLNYLYSVSLVFATFSLTAFGAESSNHMIVDKSESHASFSVEDLLSKIQIDTQLKYKAQQQNIYHENDIAPNADVEIIQEIAIQYLEDVVANLEDENNGAYLAKSYLLRQKVINKNKDTDYIVQLAGFFRSIIKELPQFASLFGGEKILQDTIYSLFEEAATQGNQEAEDALLYLEVPNRPKKFASQLQESDSSPTSTPPLPKKMKTKSPSHSPSSPNSSGSDTLPDHMSE